MLDPLYELARPWIEHDRARMARCEAAMRAAAEHNAKCIARHGTLADLKVATGIGVAVGKGGKIRQLPRHGVGR